MLESKYIRGVLVGCAFFLIACGSSKDDKKALPLTLTPIVNTTPTIINKTISLDPTKENIIQIEGKDTDMMELRFSEQSFFACGQEKLDINVTLTYKGDTLTGFSVNKDLVFSKPVYIAFDASSLKDNERFLEYIHASDVSKNYFLPFTIAGDSIIYEFSHFSAYVFHSNDVQDKINVVGLRLQALNNVSDKKGGLKSIEQQINEIYSLISIIELNDSSAALALQGEANDVAIAYGTAFIDNSTYAGALLDGNCMHVDLTTYLNEMLFNGSTIAALGATESSLSKSLVYLRDAADAFLATNPTELCTTTNGMRDYASCGVDIAEKLVALGDSTGKDGLVLSHIEEKVLDDAEDASGKACGKTCVEKAISFGAGFFTSTTLSDLDIILDGAEECTITPEATVKENQTVGITLIEGATSGVTYGISGGDAADFTVDAATGVVTFITAPDYETQSSYTFTATVTDSLSNITTETVTINISDVCDSGEIIHRGIAYCEVTSPNTGRVWLDRNLGASQVCKAFNDDACYGGYYQWGRNADGHEDSASGTITTRATDVNNAGTEFITSPAVSTDGSNWSDWALVDDTGSTRSTSWSKSDGTSVCPLGFRVPNSTELSAETNGVTHRDLAFTNFLKLPSSGYRSSYLGSLNNVGGSNEGAAYVWTSSVDGSRSIILYFGLGVIRLVTSLPRIYGIPVRCLRD